MAKYTPNSGREHPPAPKPGGLGAGGTQCQGAPINHGGDLSAATMSNAVIRNRPPLKK
jgi:hypothetical protein